MNFGEYFKNLRKSKGATQEQIAKAIGKSKMLVSGVETNKNGPFTEDDLRRISNAIGLSEEEYNDLLLEAARARHTLPAHLSSYVINHKDVIRILELMSNGDMESDSIKRVIRFVEDINNAQNC